MDAISVPDGSNVVKYHIGDILISNIRPYLRKVWLSDREGGCSADILVLSSNTTVCSNEFLHHILTNDSFIDYVMSGAKGVKMPRGDKKQIAKYTAAIPSINEQNKISTFLTLTDQRIATQIVAIEKMESLIKGLVDVLFENRKWMKVKVGDFMEFYPTNSLSWEQLQYESGAIRNLHYGIIHDTGCTELSSDTLPFISSCFVPNKFTLCMDGDVALADASEDTTDVGKTVELKGVGDYPVVCGLHTIHGRDIKGLTVPGFKGFAMNSKYFHAQLQRLAQGSKVFSINTDNVKSCYLYIPSLNEQKQLVSLFQKIEDKLCIERQLLDLYRQQKQYLLKNMFV